MMKRFNHVFLLILMALTVFNACEKDELETTNVETSEIFEDVSKHMLSFDNFKQFQDEAYRVANFTAEELKEWEQKKGFKSFGSYSDDLIDFISEENFKSEAEVDSYIKLNSDFIEIVNDGSVEPRLMHDPYRYLVNVEQKCKIGEDIAVLKNNGLFVCASINSEKAINDTLALFSCSSTKSITSDNATAAGGEQTASTNRRKMTVWLSLKATRYHPLIDLYPDWIEYDHEFIIHTRTYDKKWGRWYGAKHIHKVSAVLNAQYLEIGDWNTVPFNKSYENEGTNCYLRRPIILHTSHEYQLKFENYYITASFAGLDGRKAILEF